MPSTASVISMINGGPRHNYRFRVGIALELSCHQLERKILVFRRAAEQQGIIPLLIHPKHEACGGPHPLGEFLLFAVRGMP